MNEAIRKTIQTATEKARKTHEKLNAVVTMIDPEAQLAQLEEMDPTSPLYGVPVVLKDNVNTKGIRTTASSGILQNYIPVYDATIVQKLKAAGAIIIAKSSMDELAMGGSNKTAFGGPVLNPYDPQRISGGSSGGSAVLVASGAVRIAIGSDTGDSIRKPASFCGVVGLKPSYGRISRYGIIPYASSLDHVGLFSRNVADAALGLKVLAGRDPQDMTSLDLPVEDYPNLLSDNLQGVRVGVFRNVLEAINHPELLAKTEALLQKAAQKGAILVDVRLDDALMRAILPTYYIIANGEATANHANLDGIRFGVQVPGDTMEAIMIHSRTQGLSSFIRKRFLIGAYGLLDENQELLFRKAQRTRRLIVNELKQAFADIDVLVAPASGSIAPKLDESTLDELNDEYLVAENHMVLGNFSGYPSITIPCMMDQGCPIGLNLMGGAFADAQLLAIASAFEQLTDMQDMVKEVA